MTLHGKSEDWYVGKVTKRSRSIWCDVLFDDGALWMKTSLAERDVKWCVVDHLEVRLRSPVESSDACLSLYPPPPLPQEGSA